MLLNALGQRAFHANLRHKIQNDMARISYCGLGGGRDG
jgi:hypothetical protein